MPGVLCSRTAATSSSSHTRAVEHRVTCRPSRVHRPARAAAQRRAVRTSVLCFQGAGSSTGSPSTTQSPASTSGEFSDKPRLTVSWAGAGIFFFWQLGAMKFLAERYDLTKTPMVGASGGALAAVLAGCGVNADRVIERAYELSLEYNIWERSLGLLGVWGKLIEQWLDELLPDNAHELCRNRVTVVVTTVPDWKQIGISDFTSKQDLINACMASSHIPIFLDLKMARPCRGMLCVDGSFPDFFANENSELLKCSGQAVIFDYFEDRMVPRKGRMDMLELKTHDEVKRLMELGYQFASRLHEDGRFDKFSLAEVLLQESGHIQEVMVPEAGCCSTKEAVAGAVADLQQKLGSSVSVSQLQLN